MLKAFHLKCVLRNCSFSVVQLSQSYFSSNRRCEQTGNFPIKNDASVEPLKLAYSSYGKLSSDPAIPPVLIMHGLFGSKQNWRSTSKAIHSKTKPTRKVIALDARNHGESPHSPHHRYIDLAEDIHIFCLEHKIPKVVVIGHSMGGRAMMVFALEYPHLVEKAIIVDISPVTFSQTQDVLRKVLDVMRHINFPNNIGLRDARELADEQIKIFFPDEDTRDAILTNLYEANDGAIEWRINVDALLNNFANMSSFPGLNEYMERQYKNPILFIGGSKSGYLTAPNELMRIHEIFPRANLKFLNTGHAVHSEAPNEFLELVTDFINN